MAYLLLYDHDRGRFATKVEENTIEGLKRLCLIIPRPTKYKGQFPEDTGSSIPHLIHTMCRRMKETLLKGTKLFLEMWEDKDVEKVLSGLEEKVDPENKWLA